MFLSAGGAAYIAAGVLILIAAGLGLRQTWRMRRALRRQRFQLDTALNHMSHGLCMFDAAGVLRLFNARYLEVFNIPAGVVEVGRPLREILARLEDAGIISGDQDKYAAELVAAMAAGKRTQSRRELGDGRTTLITNRPLPGGGWVATHEDITERARAEQQAQEANAYLRDVIEAIPAGLILYDQEDRYVLCNRRFDAMYPKTADLRVPGTRLEDILRKGLARGVYESEGSGEAWLAKRLAAHALPTSMYEQHHANGRWLRIEDSRTSNGSHIGIRVDITELKQREEQLRLENIKLDAAMQNMSQGLVMFDRDSRLLVCNQRYAELYRLPPALTRPGVSQKAMLEHLTQTGLIADSGSIQFVKDRVLKGAPSGPSETLLALADGRTLHVAVRPMANGAWVSTHEDITERVRAEQQAQEANAYLRDVIEAMPAGLILYDAEDRYVLCNRRFDTMYPKTADLRVPGTRFEEMIRAGLARGVYDESRDRGEAWVAERLAAHAKQWSVYEQRHADGRWIRVEDSHTPGRGHIGMRIDITELKEREEQLRLDNIKLDAALQNMSHGLAMFDRDGKLIVCNQKYAQLYALPDEITRPGTPHQAILAHRLASGMMGESDISRIAERTRPGARLAPSETLFDLKDGRTMLVKMRLLDNGGWVATHEDITDRRAAEAQIAHMAHHDALTGLPNRVLLRQRLDEALAHAQRGQRIAVLYLDLDHFKSINDTLGHGVGDELLKAVAARLRGCLREGDTIARLGGDEFAIIQSEIATPSDVASLAGRIRDALTLPYELDGHQVPADVSVGISLAPDDTLDPDQLLKNADMALYRSKADGRGTYRFFEAQMDERVRARRTLELDLRNAIANGEFELYFQPLVNLERNEISACETLLRWHHPVRGMVPPAEFIPVAEETGLINQIGEWVLRQACREAASWPASIAVAVNLSPVQFKNHNLGLLVVSALGDSGLAPNRLEVEITEAVLLQNNEATLATLHRLRDLGVRIAMDDFGTGYSSLSYLRSFPFDKIKIDRSFIHDISEKDESGAIVQAVTSLASRLNIATTAEGVETQEQLRMIQVLGCTEMQGYLYSRPVPIRDLARLISPPREAAGSVA